MWTLVRPSFVTPQIVEALQPVFPVLIELFHHLGTPNFVLKPGADR